MRHLLLCAVLLGCQSSPQPPLDIALSVLRTVGDAVIRVDGFAALKKYAPEAIPLIDTDQNKVVTLAEIEAVAAMLASNPESAAGVLAAAYWMYRQRKE